MITAQQFTRLLSVPAGESASMYLESNLPVGSLQDPRVILFNTSEADLSWSLEVQLNFGDTGTDGMTGNHTTETVADTGIDAGEMAAVPLSTSALIPYTMLVAPMRHKLTVTNESESDVTLPVLYTGWADRPATKVADFRAIEED